MGAVAAFARQGPTRHGDRCSCRVLAAAVGCSATTIGYAFCQDVLRKRWTMQCNHGCQPVPAAAERGSHWRGIGRVDAIKAILIDNE